MAALKQKGDMTRQAVLYPREAGYWVAECPSLRGYISQGGTKQGAIANIKEAIEGYILSLQEDNLPATGITSLEIRDGLTGRGQLETRRYGLEAPDTPVALRRCVGAGSASATTLKGDLSIFDKRLIGFFCSVRCPGDVILKTYDLARALRETEVTIVGGFQSLMEKEFLDLLLRGAASAVVCPARGIGNMRIPKSWKKPLDEGRLLLLSFFDDSIRRPTATIAARRNAYVATLADCLLIAHTEKGGKIEKLCLEALTEGKAVLALDSPDNAHLAELDITPVLAEDPSPFISKGSVPSC